MRSINSALMILGLIVGSLTAAPYAYTQETRPPADLSGSSEIHSQAADETPIELAQATNTTGPNTSPGSADATVSAKALLDAKVLDASNREMGSIRNILVEPQTGKLVRADIALNGAAD